MTEWIFPRCDLCGELEGEDILVLEHPDAPGGAASIRRCGRCGLRRLWPRPGDQVLQRYYSSDYGAYTGRRRSPAKQAVWDLLRDGASGAPGRGRALAPLRPLLRILAHWAFDTNVPLDRDPLPRILDVGCGFGDLLLYWQSRGADTLGVDFEQRAVNAATKLGLKVLKGALEEQDLPAESFDVVVFNHSLEHLAHPTETLKLAARLLRRGGTIHITVPNGASAGLVLEKDAWEALRFPVHFWFFDMKTLSGSLKLAGFTQLKFYTKNMWRDRWASWHPINQRVRAWWAIVKMSWTKKYTGDLISVTGRRA